MRGMTRRSTRRAKLKGCGCPDAIASLENVGQQSLYAGNAQNITSAQQYGKKIKAYGEEAVATLRKCPGN